MAKVYTNPQTCERCPHRHSKNGCPAWVDADHGFIEGNIATGEQRVVTGCFYQVVPKLMVHLVQASNRPAAVLQEMRNETAQAMGQIATAVQNMLPRLEKQAALQLEHQDNGEGK